jgi:ParB family transcriptional regulator, chromosome partitioning protein
VVVKEVALLDKDNDTKERGLQMQLFEAGQITEAKTPPTAIKKRNTQYQAGKMYHVAINEITLNPEQPRRFFNETELLALAESIRSNGLLQPLLCQVKENRLQLLAGERRLRAAGLADLGAVPVRVVTGDPLEIALIENLLRSDLTAIEEAEAIAALKKKKGFRLEDLAGITGKAVPTLSEILSITRLPTKILDACRSAQSVPRDILVLIARLPGSDEKIAAFEQYLKGTLNRENLALRARRMKMTPKKKFAPFTFIRGVAKRFSRFDIGAMSNDEKEKLRNELKKLLGSIEQTLDNLE